MSETSLLAIFSSLGAGEITEEEAVEALRERRERNSSFLERLVAALTC